MDELRNDISGAINKALTRGSRVPNMLTVSTLTNAVWAVVEPYIDNLNDSWSGDMREAVDRVYGD